MYGDGPPTALVLEAHGATELVVPGRDFILAANYTRQGSDLVLTGADGRRVLIHDFFTTDSPPTLLTESGARIPPELALKLAGPLAPGQYAQAAPAVPGQPIGKVETITGEATATHTDGTTVSLTRGAPVFAGDVVETGPEATLGLVFVDKTTFALTENARMVLDELIYDPSTNEGSSIFSIIKGLFVIITGEIAKANPADVTIKTPSGTIGIRGTEFGVSVEVGAEMTVTVFSG